MTKNEFADHLRWFSSRFPAVYKTISGQEFINGWFGDFFQSVDDVDARLARLDMATEEILPNAERFLSKWYQHAKRHEAERLRRETRSATAAKHAKTVREVLETGHCGRIFKASLQIPWDRSEPWELSERKRFIDAEFAKLDESGVRY